MKNRGFTLIEALTVVTIVSILVSLCYLAVKTISSSVEIQSSLPVIDSLLGLSRNTARKNGLYAGIYFYDQNDSVCAMEVIDNKIIDYNDLEIVLLWRLEGSEIHELGPKGFINQSVVIFSKEGRLAWKKIRINNYQNLSDRNLQIDDVNYTINSYTGKLIR